MIEALLPLPASALRQRLRQGHAVEPDALAGHRYRGVSLGLPAWVDRLAWKTFEKAFHLDLDRGVVRGWNVRLEQTGLDGPVVARRRGGGPFTFGHFHVLRPEGGVEGVSGAVMLDYGPGGNPLLDPTALVRDPLVALRPDDPTLLLGCSHVGPLRTPSFFVLERVGPVEHVAEPPRG